nr:hypothetical protein [uncultured Lichenicoccus sp.]
MLFCLEADDIPQINADAVPQQDDLTVAANAIGISQGRSSIGDRGKSRFDVAGWMHPQAGA